MAIAARRRSSWVPRPPVSRTRPRRRGVLPLLALVVLLLVPTVSYAQALTYPGDAPLSVRTVEWVRDHGGGGIVDTLENWWYAHPPSGAAPDPSSLPSRSAAPGGPEATAPAPLGVAAGLTPLPGEGQWAASRIDPRGRPAIYTTFERPDPQHPSVVAGVARIDTRTTALTLIPGTAQPVRDTRPGVGQVPPDARGALVATFNSGFKMIAARGGFVLGGHPLVPLRQGAAAVVIRRDGTATVGQWGRDVSTSADVVAVRQNLDLIVDGARPVAGLTLNAGQRWGSAKNQFQYTWRSGLGVDATGTLIYVGGAGMNLAALADALARAGAVRGMELDIHGDMVDFFTYPHGGATTSAGVKLLPAMPNGPSRYLVPDQRDFFAATLR